MISGTFKQLAVIGLAIIAWALTEQLGGNGFIGAFAAGLATGRITGRCGQDILDFIEDEGQLLNLAVFFIFGIGAIGFLGGAGWEVVVFGLLSLTLIRMLPVALSMLGTGLRGSSIAFLAWFGPRGLASISLALVVVEEEPDLSGLEVVLAAMTEHGSGQRLRARAQRATPGPGLCAAPGEHAGGRGRARDGP
jgi:NhaP-type Na+/H+ or K+/H+ antiporter